MTPYENLRARQLKGEFNHLPLGVNGVPADALLLRLHMDLHTLEKMSLENYREAGRILNQLRLYYGFTGSTAEACIPEMQAIITKHTSNS